MFNRRSFIKNSLLFLGSIPVVGYVISSCTYGKKKTVEGGIVGASAAIGHKLREGHFPEPSEIRNYDYVIVGGGIAGLSAARYLYQQNNKSFAVLEMDQKEGGNSTSGSNSVSSYPWGAHYLPIANNHDEELKKFLEEIKVITHYNSEGLPYYDEYYLCHAPEERLYIHGHWQDGLIPSTGLPEKDILEIKRFLKEMEEWRLKKGSDGLYAFDIPLDRSSQDLLIRALDKISLAEYLKQQSYSSPYLHWYVDYCCRDDYGATMNNVSAWSGIHYFAGRKAKAANADSSEVLTWPEGNSFLVEGLKRNFKENIHKDCLVHAVSMDSGKVIVDYLNVKKGISERIIAKKCIVCSPQFVTQRLLRMHSKRDHKLYSKFQYGPWVIANITVTKLAERSGRPLSWDNVIYNSPSLGYIHSNHQNLKIHSEQRVLTYYKALTDLDSLSARKKAYATSYEEWTKEIIEELSKVHPNFEESVQKIDVWVWGHGMITPEPGFIWGEERKIAKEPIDNKVFFAHSDLSGISIFEEAFHQGIRAAKEALI